MSFNRLIHFLAYWKKNYKGFFEDYSKSNDSQIVICGLPRSGTSLLFNLMAASATGYEPYVGVRKHSREASYKDVINTKGSFISKQPTDVFRIRDLKYYNLVGKQAYFIVTIRDLRDLILSEHQNLPGKKYIDFEGRWDPFNEVYRNVGIKKFCSEIDRVTHLPNVLLVKYEDLILKSEEVQERIEEKFKIPFSIKFSEYHKEKDRLIYSEKFDEGHNKEVAFRNEDKGLRSQSIDKWKKSENVSFVKEQFLLHPEMNELLIKYGYEKELDWIKEL